MAPALVTDMDEKVFKQVTYVATLPGIERASYALPDAHWGYGSDDAKDRQRDEMGTLESGNQYLEVQRVATILDPPVASTFGLRENDEVVSIHCGSRRLGHQPLVRIRM